MSKDLLITLVGLFMITSFTNVLATLKTILISKKIMNPVYIVVFVDAMIFATILTKVTSSVGIQFTIAYACGKTFGVFVGGKLESKLALGIIEVDVFISNRQKMIGIAEKLRQEGYTVNNFLARGLNGEPRHKIEVVMKRKEFKVLESTLLEFGVVDPTLKIKNLSKVGGKITTTNVATN